MKRAFASAELPVVVVDRRKATPLHRQLYDGYRDAILEGRLKAGQRLPSTRRLAEELGVSRLPVVSAFEQLRAEGFIQGRVGAGSFVAESLSSMPKAVARKRALPAERKPVIPPPSVAPVWLGGTGAFRVSLPALDQLPTETFARIVARQARRLPRTAHAYADPMGMRPLRTILAEYLETSRGVRADPGQMMIVSGSQQALALCAHVLLGRDGAVWLEEPGYRGARAAFELAGARVVPVPVDDEGLNVAAGLRAAPDARAAYVTPSHQYPLGITMTARRRLEMLAWAKQHRAWILEDDYDSEYRYESAPIAALQALQPDARAVYIGTFSKVLFPALRVGYLVLPPELVEDFARVRDALDVFPAPLMQLALADFISEGHFVRHLRRMRMLYRERRTALVEALEEELGADARILGADAGMHLVAELPEDISDDAVSRFASARGLCVMPLSSCRVVPGGRPGLVLGYASTPAAKMREAVRQLALAIGDARRKSPPGGRASDR